MLRDFFPFDCNETQKRKFSSPHNCSPSHIVCYGFTSLPAGRDEKPLALTVLHDLLFFGFQCISLEQPCAQPVLPLVALNGL